MNEQVHRVLRQFPHDCQSTHVESLGSAGGFSGAQFWRLATPRGLLALRRWPQEHPSASRLAWIHETIQRAADSGLAFLPTPLRTSGGETVVRHAAHYWELAPWMPGKADFNDNPSDKRLAAAMCALGRVHEGMLDRRGKNVSPSLTQRAQRIDALASGEIDRLLAAVDDSNYPVVAPIARRHLNLASKCVQQVRQLIAHAATMPLQLQPCLRDVWHDHVFFTNDEVTGVIDFGAMRHDTVAADVARLLGSLAADDRRMWEVGIDAYHAARPLTYDERTVVTALDAAHGLIGGTNWIRWLFVEGRLFERMDEVETRMRWLQRRLASFAEQGPTWLT